MFRQLICALLICSCLFATGCMKKQKAKKDPYEAVAIGMTEQEVVKLLGKPVKRMSVPREGPGGGNQIVLRWMGTHHLIHVSFQGGQVVGKQRT